VNQGCEVAFLAYSFSKSFGAADNLVKAVLPSYNNGQVLVVTVYLDDGANRDDNSAWCYFHPEWNATQFWGHVRDASLHTDWVSNMSKPAGVWIRNIKAWANSKQYAGRLRVVVVPVLEDGGPNGANPAPGWAYARLRDWTAEGIGDSQVTYRRNSTAAHPDRLPGVPMEFHTATLNSAMQGNDVITADGVNGFAGPSESDWTKVETMAHARNISALWWVGAFNSNTSTRSTPPWKRGPLTPFTRNPRMKADAIVLLGTK
jgi:hypothetical protein